MKKTLSKKRTRNFISNAIIRYLKIHKMIRFNADNIRKTTITMKEKVK
jgi:hypothetical protein